jgi:hypothetical protein
MKAYSLIEKLAIVKTLDEVIISNGEIAPGEIKMLNEIMQELEFNADFVEEARKMRFSDSIDVLKRMPLARKKLFAELMHKVAYADGYVDEMETNLIIDIYKEAAIDIENPESSTVELDLSYLSFDARGYYDYPEGKKGSRTFLEMPRLIKIEPVVETKNEYTLMIYDKSESGSLWGREIVFKPLLLKLTSSSGGKIIMHSDEFEKTEVCIYHDGPEIESLEMALTKPFKFLEYVG